MNAPETLKQKVVGMNPYLRSKVIGQNHVIPRVCSVMERALLGLSPSDQPLGTMLFLGPTGVGKTLLFLEMIRYVFGEGFLFRFDMSEFQHPDSVKLLLGDETGSIGRLGRTLAVANCGGLLFDEIEKAHPSIWEVFLQINDAARITLADHCTYDLSGFIVGMTSNVGADMLLRPTKLPFATLERTVLAQVHRTFRPEWIGRFDEKLVFKILSPEIQRQIADQKIEAELSRLATCGHQLKIREDAVEFLIRRGINRTFGARPLVKAIRKYLGDAVTLAVKSGLPSSGDVRVSKDADALVIGEAIHATIV